MAVTKESFPGWNISVTGRHVHVTEGMKQHAFDKISKMQRFSDRIVDVAVTMDIQKLEHRADIVLRDGHTKIKAQAATNDMYVSVDQAVGKLERQLKRYKDKLHKHHARGLSAVEMDVNVYRSTSGESELEEINSAIEQENLKASEEAFKPHEVVNKETRPLKILTTDEAIMKMDLSKDLFTVFKNEEDMKLRVIYRRSDGDYGIIKPE